jgi:SNF family Na+-dependent transporter
MARQRWGSQLGVVLAVAGSAIGLGNLLRFPGMAAKNGGGAFMIPYFVALFLLGLPLMWIEWTLGRFGGGFGHSTAPGIFHTLWEKNRFIKYFGVIGIFGPIVIFAYYVYIESWILAYAWFALTGAYDACADWSSMQAFLNGYRGLVRNEHFSGLGTAYGFFLGTFLVNVVIVYFGIRRGIETVCKVGLPLLVALGVVLMVRVFTLPPARPDWTVLEGLGFLWNPDWSALGKPEVWLAAAGQVFFTLSVGIGVILTYASYLTPRQDVALSGLTAASANEVAEVILGGSLIIPAAFVFLGPQGTNDVARSTFDLACVTMPLVLRQVAGGNFFGFLWFLLLFIAGLTSSISLMQPAIAFLEDEFGLSRRAAILLFALVTFLMCQTCIFGLGHGTLGEFDFWGGQFCLVLFGTVEVILFGWVFGADEAWVLLHVASDITIPRFYRFIIKYVTPAFLIAILGAWLWQLGVGVLLMKQAADGSGPVPEADKPYVLMARRDMLALFGMLALLVYLSWRRREALGAAGPPQAEGHAP